MKKKEAKNAISEIIRNGVLKPSKQREAKNTIKELRKNGYLKLSRK